MREAGSTPAVDYYNAMDTIYECYEEADWKREETPRGFLFRMPEELGTGHVAYAGNMDTCFTVETDLCYRNDYYARYNIDEKIIEITQTYLAEGVQNYQTKDDTRAVSAGVQSFVNLPPFLYYTFIPAGQRTKYHGLYLRENFIQSAGVDEEGLFWSTLARLANELEVTVPTFQDVLLEVESCQHGKRAFEVFLEAKGLEVLAAMIALTEERSDSAAPCLYLSKDDKARIRRIVDILNEDIANPPSIIDLSGRVNLNRKKMQQGFKQLFGKTIHEYATDLRMQKAVVLLSEEDVSIEEIAHRVGYKGASNFYLAFKKYFGVTPHKLRGVVQR